MRLAIVGRGRLGTAFGAALAARHEVVWPGRGTIPGDVELVLLTVPDRSVAEVALRVPVGPIVVHCAGVLSHEVLRPHPRVARFHPVLPFSGGPTTWRGVAALSGDPDAIAVMAQLAPDLDLDLVTHTGDARLWHAAATLAGNGSAALTEHARRWLLADGLDEDDARRVLHALVHASVDAVLDRHELGLTGPSVRGDAATLALHREVLVERGLSARLDLVRALHDAVVALIRPGETGPM